MRLLAVFPPARQEPLLHDLLKNSALTLTAWPSRTWPGHARIQPGADAPLVWPVNRGARLSMAALGRKLEDAPFILTVPAEGVRIARRCLVPISAVEFEQHGRTYRLTPHDEPYAFIGATWWPGGKDRAFAAAYFALLTTGPQADLEGVLAEGLVYIPSRHHLDWLDSSRDTLTLQRTPDFVPFKVEEIVGENLAPLGTSRQPVVTTL